MSDFRHVMLPKSGDRSQHWTIIHFTLCLGVKADHCNQPCLVMFRLLLSTFYAKD